VNPADERVRELLDSWLASLELHLKYVALDEAAYRDAQPWPPHDRPSRWIIEVAKGKARELRDQVESRVKMGDARFSEALELMAFLVNLVGARVDRFIPLADPTTAVDVSTATQKMIPAAAAPVPSSAPAAVPTAAAPPAVARTPLARAAPEVRAAPEPRPAPEVHAASVVLVAPTIPSMPPAPVIPVTPPTASANETKVVPVTESGELRALSAALDATREMPRPVVRQPPRADDTVETPRAKPDTRKATRRESKPRAQPERSASAKETSAKDVSAMVVADAVRLIVWGRKWHELVELIGRFADRPSATEIRRILRENRASIEKTADKERSKKKK
jgi:hypothetical protein